MRFTYKNSDGSIKTGIADYIDRSRLKSDPSGNQMSRLKFVYTVREGDEFKAEDIMEMELIGGVITDNAYNRLPDSQRKISFQSSDQKPKTSATADDYQANSRIYRQYIQNFSVETTPPVLLSINGDMPEGNVDGELGIYLKYSEPVYLVKPDESKVPEGYRCIPWLIMNSQYVNPGKGALADEAPYFSGDGTSQLRFTFRLDQKYASSKRAFDPLEVVDSVMMVKTREERIEFGQAYIADAAGNIAPLLPVSGDEAAGLPVKLSDNKYYTSDTVPPEIHISARKTENGYSVRVDVTEDGSGLNYDEVKFRIADYRYTYGSLHVIPGKEYGVEELASMFDLTDTGWGSYYITASAQDNAGNYAYKNIEVSRANFDIKGAEMNSVTDHGYGNYTIGIADDKFGSGVASVRQKWVSSGTDPDLIDWSAVKYFSPGVSDKVEINPPEAPYIWKKADLYIEAIDKAGNRNVFSIPDAYHKPDEGSLRVTWRIEAQNRYIIDALYNSKGDRYEYPPGIWFCMTEQPEMPRPEEGSWLYKTGGTIDTLADLGMSVDTSSGLRYLHIRAVNNLGQVLAAGTVPNPFSFDAVKPEIHVYETRDGRQWKFQVAASDNNTLPEDIKLNYKVNADKPKPLENGGIITVDPGSLRYFTLTITADDRNRNRQTFNQTYTYDLSTEDGKLPEPYIYADYGPWNSSFGSIFGGTAYTRDNFAQLEVFTTGNEFSYSIDGVKWSNWLPLTPKNTFNHMDMGRYYDLVNSTGYKVYSAYVPLPDREGAITFLTRYRKGTRLVSDPVETTVVRDVTPPAASVEFSETTFTTIAKLVGLSDNISPAGAITISRDSEFEFCFPGSHTFTIRDAAGNIAEITASVTEVGSPPEPERDTDAPVISITDTTGGAIVRQLSATVSASDSSPFTLKYAWSQDNNYGNIPAGDWTSLANGSVLNLTCAPGQDGIWHLYVRATDSEGNSRVESREYTLDVTTPVIRIQPNGSAVNITRADVDIDVDDRYIVDAWYFWSQDGNSPGAGSGEWIALNTSFQNSFRVSRTDVDGTWYLHVKAADRAGNTAIITSNPFQMVKPGTAPYVVYSGEEEGTIRAYVVSSEEIAVTGAAYFDLLYDPENPTATHDFHYTYPDGATGIVTASYTYQDRTDIDDTLMWKGDVEITPSDATTSGSVDVVITVPVIPDYHRSTPFNIEIRNEDEEGDLYEYFFGEGSNPNNVLILEGLVMDRVSGTSTEIPENTPFSSVELEDSQYLLVQKLKLITNAIGNIHYNIDDGVFVIRIGHIVDASKQGNVTVAASDSPFARQLIVASAYSRTLSFPAGMLLAANTKTAAGIPSAKAQITYTQADPDKKAVTAKIEFSDKGMTVISNGGKNTFEFTGNGQFVFEYGKAGYIWRSLAEVSSFNTDMPEVDISYSSLLPTNQPVRVTMAPSDGSKLVSGDVRVTPENGVYWFETSENGQWNFIFENAAGNRATVTATVENIDMTPPRLSVVYINDYNSGTVKAVLNSDETLRMPEGKAQEHVFKQNGEYVFTAEDGAGNRADITATVSNLPFPDFQSGIDVTVNYSTTNPTSQPVRITLESSEPFTVVNTCGKSSVLVYKNGAYPFIVRDAYGLYKLVEANVANIAGTIAEEKGPVVLVNGIEAGTEPIGLDAKKLTITTVGFLGEVTVKWAKGHRTAAYFKNGGETAAGGEIPVSDRGWITLQVYDNERNIRLVHVLVNKVGGTEE